jgi:hypothetical protein
MADVTEEDRKEAEVWLRESYLYLQEGNRTRFERDRDELAKFRAEARAAGAAEERVADWMMQRSYATGHGDTVESLLGELEWQAIERGRRR